MASLRQRSSVGKHLFYLDPNMLWTKAETQAQPAGPPMDTSVEALAVTQERIGALRPDQKAQLANIMSIDCERLARAGIAISEPSASDARVRYLLAVRRYGSAFADTMLGRGAC